MSNSTLDSRICGGRVFIEGLELHAFHGCFAHERQNGQMFEINLDLTVDLREAAASDDLAAPVDYGKAVAVTQRVFCGKPRHLVEAAALDVARALLEAFPRLDGAIVRVGKLAPPIPGKLRVAGIQIEGKRGR